MEIHAEDNEPDLYVLSRWHSGGESACQCRRPKRCGFDPHVGKIPWRRAGNTLQYSCLENPMDKRAWLAIVHGVAKECMQQNLVTKEQ